MQSSTLIIKDSGKSTTDTQFILNELKDAKKISNVLQTHLMHYTDQNVTKYLRLLDHSINQIQNSISKPKKDDPIQQPRQVSHMKRLSLLEILKRSIPKNTPRTIKIELPDSDVEIFGHMYKLIVLFSNLFENSIQAMHDNGKISIKIESFQHKVHIDIIDSGPGIPMQIMNKMFSSLSTTKEHGTGLGTKMAKTIINLHGGTISVKNNPTTFTIELPMEQN